MTAPVKMGVIRVAKRFYDGSPGRELVSCPDCDRPADKAVGGDHSGTCLQRFGFSSSAKTDPARHDDAVAAAVAIIRDVAEHQWEVSANSTRAMMDAAGIAGTVRSAAFRAAVRDGVIEAAGYAQSTEASPHGAKHRVRTYASLVCTRSAAVKQPRRLRAAL